MIKNIKDVKSYVNNRMIVDRLGYSVIFTAESEKIVPTTCDVCDFALRSQDDEHTYEKFRCCSRCAVSWVYPNVEKWNEGWRPSSDEIKLNTRPTTVTRLTF